MVAETTAQDAVARIEAQLKQGQRHFTLPEAAAMTGLSIDASRHALEALLNRYVCRLQVSENGDLIYHFGETLQRRGKKTAAERRAEILAWIWRIFTVVYKAWIAVTLVIYFVFFLILLIVVMLAAASKRSSHRDRDAPLPMAGLFNLFISIFQWRTITGGMEYRRDPDGYPYRHYAPRPAVLNKTKKSFIASVYDFVFGPPRVDLDPLANERELAAYLLENKGIVVTAELSALAGWTLPQAETFFADCVVRYDGEAKVSDRAVLYGQFDNLMRRVGAVETGEMTYYWDEYEPEYELTGNSSTHNAIIICMNGFNLLMSSLVVSSDLSALAVPEQLYDLLVFVASHETLVKAVLGWVPLMFSLLFFLIPLARWFKIKTLQERRHQQNIRKRLWKAIFARQGEPQTVDDVLSTVNTGGREERLSRQVVETQLKALVLDMPGDMSVSDTAEVQFAFPRITTELREVAYLRRRRAVDDTLGDTLIESDNV